MKKLKRIVNKELLKSYHLKPCIICGFIGEPHHIKSVGSGGDDIESNLWCLCRFHHQEVHFIGKETFRIKYSL